MCKRNEYITYQVRRHSAIILRADAPDGIPALSAEQVYMETRTHEAQPEQVYYTAELDDAEYWIKRHALEIVPVTALYHAENNYSLRAVVYTLDVYDDEEYQYTIDIKAQSWGV